MFLLPHIWQMTDVSITGFGTCSLELHEQLEWSKVFQSSPSHFHRLCLLIFLLVSLFSCLSSVNIRKKWLHKKGCERKLTSFKPTSICYLVSPCKIVQQLSLLSFLFMLQTFWPHRWLAYPQTQSWYPGYVICLKFSSLWKNLLSLLCSVALFSCVFTLSVWFLYFRRSPLTGTWICQNCGKNFNFPWDFCEHRKHCKRRCCEWFV